MKRLSLVTASATTCLLAAAAVLIAGLLSGRARAASLEVGKTVTPLVAPTCPAGVTQDQCTIVLTETTAIESMRDGVTYPTAIHKAGELVAFSLGISALSTNASTLKKDLAYLQATYGGPPQVQLTVLRPVGLQGNFRWTVAAESQPVTLLPYLGQVAQFPLPQALPVVPGEVVGLTIPTWAPILSIDLTPAANNAYRQSRSQSCSTPTPKVVIAQLAIGQTANYGCTYPGTRVEYSATEITSPTPNPGS